MLWEEYLISKKIDSTAFREKESDLWKEWKALFEQVHPNSFTAQKLYLINPIRRKYPLPESELTNKETTKKPMVKPKLNKATPKVAKPKALKPKPVFKKPKID